MDAALVLFRCRILFEDFHPRKQWMFYSLLNINSNHN
nr:MAG TPA: Protein CASC5 domain, CELL CYCLE [Caudoviricetes sp.]